MTPKQRLLNTLNGKKVDRVAIYPQIPFAVTKEGFEPGAFHGYSDYDNWRAEDPMYRKLVERIERDCDNFYIWRPPCMLPEHFLVPSFLVKTLPPIHNNGKIITTNVLNIGGHSLQSVFAVNPGTGHTWQLEHICKTPEDAKKLMQLPWQEDQNHISDYFEISQMLGEKAVFWVTIPSPVLVVCRLFDPMHFLMFVRTESNLIFDLLETVSKRIYNNLDKLLSAGAGPIVRFGGAEHATPPMLSPADFDNLVVKYDKPLMDLCKQYNCKVAVHCHGQIRHALKRFVEMGVDQVDPVECYPDGDLTLLEAKEISENAITLTGNIQMRELYNSTPEHIDHRVRQIISEAGPGKLILSTTGTPLEKISDKLAENYHCFIESAHKYSKL